MYDSIEYILQKHKSRHHLKLRIAATYVQEIII